MGITVTKTDLDGVVIIEPLVRRDPRGFFYESYNKRELASHGITWEFVQDNHSRSAHKVLRGLHFQDSTAPLTKLVRCTLGAIVDVAVDIRAGSPTFGKWVAVELSAENARQILVPEGFAHGFATLTEFAEVQYKCSGWYVPAAEGCIAWNDPDIGIAWPFADPILSQRDQVAQSLQAYLAQPAFIYSPSP
jgi:dTDP-4-dehydrorhamnose 3,5-epimerase